MYSAPSVRIRWLDQPVMLHSAREDSCDLTPEQCAYKQNPWRNWYQADFVYGRAVVYFVCATVGVFAILHLLARYGPDSRGNRLVQRVRAAGRYVAYRSAPVWLTGPLSFGLAVPLLIGVGIIFFFGVCISPSPVIECIPDHLQAITLGPKPYYWDNRAFGYSPPIANRAGWLALGLLPFVLYGFPLPQSSIRSKTLFKGPRVQGELHLRIDRSALREAPDIPPMDKLRHVCPRLDPHLPVHHSEYPRRYHGAGMEDVGFLVDRRCCTGMPGIPDNHVIPVDQVRPAMETVFPWPMLMTQEPLLRVLQVHAYLCVRHVHTLPLLPL